jgi:hypothetical protein
MYWNDADLLSDPQRPPSPPRLAAQSDRARRIRRVSRGRSPYTPRGATDGRSS